MTTRDEVLDAIDGALERLDLVLAEESRDDLCARVAGARARLDRPTTVVCVVGEFKQGKSSLVNAIVGSEVCPVDDDIATSVLTLVRHGEQPGAIVRRRVDGEPAPQRMSVEEAMRHITATAEGAERVERVDITVPSAALADGLALVDTPGAGGLRAGHGAATLSFLPFADGMVFVTDGTAELSQPELDFLTDARSRCPHVIVAVTKTDIAPEWRRIKALDEGHFERLGLDIPVFAVSSELHRCGGDTGVQALLAALDARIVQPARSSSATRIGTEVAGLVRSVGEGLERRREVLVDPGALAALEARVAAAVQRIDHLRGPGARWSIALGDRMSDLSNDAGFQFRGAVRELLRTHEEAIETLKTSEQWEQQAARLQDDLAGIVSNLFVTIENGRHTVRDELLDLLTAEDEELGGVQGGLALKELSVGDLWRAKPLERGSLGGKAVQTGLTGLRGAQSGIMLLDRKSTRLNSSHNPASRMPSSA
jgi:signal recognition particle receptor subunit beta